MLYIPDDGIIKSINRKIDQLRKIKNKENWLLTVYSDIKIKQLNKNGLVSNTVAKLSHYWINNCFSSYGRKDILIRNSFRIKARVNDRER